MEGGLITGSGALAGSPQGARRVTILPHSAAFCTRKMPQLLIILGAFAFSSSGGCRFESYMAHQQNQGVAARAAAPFPFRCEAIVRQTTLMGGAHSRAALDFTSVVGNPVGGGSPVRHRFFDMPSASSSNRPDKH